MSLWQLQPVDITSASWEASSYRGKVIVRARDEAAAREMAERAFGVKTRFPPGRGLTAPPWKRADLVTAEVVDIPLYSPKGPWEILYPPQE